MYVLMPQGINNQWCSTRNTLVDLKMAPLPTQIQKINTLFFHTVFILQCSCLTQHVGTQLHTYVAPPCKDDAIL
jgi:hypothetical protein